MSSIDSSEQDKTPPMGTTIGSTEGPASITTLTVLEGLIRGLDSRISNYIEEQREQAAKFYATRMVPLEARVARLTIVAWFGLGLASAAMLVGAAVILALIIR